MFGPGLRVLLCASCAAPLEAELARSRVTCAYCGAVSALGSLARTRVRIVDVHLDALPPERREAARAGGPRLAPGLAWHPAGVILLAACAPWTSGPDTSPPDSQLLVGPAADLSGYVLLDARSEDAWASGHLPDALSVPWSGLEVWTADGLWDEDERASAAAWLSGLGLPAEGPYLVYGDPLEDWGGDGFLYWALRHLGVSELRVLDGGYPLWVEAGGEPDDVASQGAGGFELLPLPDPPVLATTAEVAASEDQLLDVRSPDEYAAGHLPGAVNVEYVDALDAEARFLGQAELEDLLAGAGLSEGPTITYCERGVRAGHGFLLLEILGWPARDYVGSWAAWQESGGETER